MTHVTLPRSFAAAALVALLTLVASQLAGVPIVTDPRLVNGPLEEPADWLTSARGVPDGRAYAAALEQARDVGSLTEQLDPALARLEWDLQGPTNIGGRLTDIAVDPHAADTVFAAAASGGVWKSTDAGATFTEAWPRDITQAVGALAITAEGTLFAGTGEANPGGGSLTFGGTGIYRSTDGAETWEHVGLPDSGNFGRIVVDPTDPSRIYAAATGHLYVGGGERGVYRSTDGGDTWELVLAGANETTGAVDLAIDPTNPDRLYATMWDHIRKPEIRVYGGEGSGLFESLDGGDTWRAVDPAAFGPGDADIGRIGVAIAPSDPDVVYVSVIDTYGRSSGNGLFRSDDGGATWTRTASPPSQSSFGWWFGRIFVDPDDPMRVWIPGVSLSVSDDGGSSFTTSGGVHADQHAMAWDPKVPERVYLGNDGGFYRSDVDGGSWVKATYEPWTQLYTLDVAELAPDRIVAGLQDNGCVRNYGTTRETGAGSWTSFGICGDGLETLINPANPENLFGCSQYGLCSRSDVGGDAPTGAIVAAGASRQNWQSPLEFHRALPTAMLFGSERVHLSLDGGATWAPISDDLTTGADSQVDPAGYPYATLTTVAGAASDLQTIYAGSDDGLLHRTTDLGQTWTLMDDEDLPQLWVTKVAVDPDDADTVFVTFSGYRTGDDAARISWTTDGGQSWDNISGNLPAAPVNDVELVGDDAIAVATDVGVFLTSRDELDGPGVPVWLRIGRDLPLAPVMDLDHHEATGALTAATFGRSAWRTTLPT